MTYLLLLIPAIYTLWRTSKWAIKKTKDYAKKKLFFSYVPQDSVRGNNPDSQRVHEGGGGGVSGLITGAGGLVVASVAIVAGYLLQYDPRVVLIVGFFGTLLGMVVVWNAHLEWLDIGEHAAECAHGDKALANGTLHPDALKWLKASGHETYTAGEIARMQQGGYRGKSSAELLAMFKNASGRARWVARMAPDD